MGERVVRQAGGVSEGAALQAHDSARRRRRAQRRHRLSQCSVLPLALVANPRALQILSLQIDKKELSAIVGFARMRGATSARNCAHGVVLPGGAKLVINYLRALQARWREGDAR